MFRTPDHAPLLNARRAGVAVAASLAVAALVAGCGGGDKVKAFQPTQVIVFGDENGAFDNSTTTPLVTVNGVAFKGSRYTINLVTIPDQGYCALGTTPITAIDCAASPLAPALDSAETPTVNSKVFTTPSQSGTGVPTVQLINELQQRTLNTIVGGVTTSTRSAQYSIDRYYDCSPGASAYSGNWAQYLAYVLGSNLSLGGSNQCPQDSGNGISHAFWGAKVDDVVTQLDTTFRGELREGVLVAVLVGQNDIVAAYNEVTAATPTLTRENALIRMRSKGQALGEAIKRIPDTGARVVFLTVPNMGKSPKAIADNQVALATDLTHAFNEGYNNVGGLVLGAASQQGHKIVKVDGYSQISALAPNYPTVAACDTDESHPAGTFVAMPDGTKLSDVPAIFNDPDLLAQAQLLNCTNGTLVSGATISSHLWADDWHLAPVGHVSLGSLAVARIRDQL